MEYKFTKEQLNVNITPNYLFWLLQNKLGYVPKMQCSVTNDYFIATIDDVSIDDEKKIISIFDNITEREDEKCDGTIMAEFLDFNDRLKKLKEFCTTKDNLTFKFFPTSEGCYDRGNYKNYQRFFFNRKLSLKEIEEIKQLLSQQWLING